MGADQGIFWAKIDRMFAIQLVASILLVGVMVERGFAGEPVSHSLSELTDVQLATIDLQDGSVRDWEAALGPPMLTETELFLDPRYSSGHSYVQLRLWMAWHQRTGRIYLAVERMEPDSSEYVRSSEGVNWSQAIQYDGAVELMVDGDHSGGNYGLGVSTQRYVAIAEALDGEHIHPMVDQAEWLMSTQYTDGYGSVSAQGGAPRMVLEFYVTPFDSLVSSDPLASHPSQLRPGRVIGLELSIPDYRTQPGHYIALWSLSGIGIEAARANADGYADITLDGGIHSTAIQPTSYSILKRLVAGGGG